jgi:hypothetical protein
MESHWKRFLAINIVCLFPLLGLAEEVKFEKEKIKLGGKTLTVEMARTPLQHEHGLMFRKSLGENDGMLFVFQDEETRYFWMKNTIIDLSIGYFDKEKSLTDIQEMTATSLMETRPPSYPSAKPAMYALEMNKGWFAKNKIKVGQKFEFVKR